MLRKFDPAASLSVQYVWDDFPGVYYSHKYWSTRSGGGSVSVPTSCIGGQIQVRANANNYYEVYQSSLQFSLAKTFQITWRGKIVDLTSSRAAWGMQTDATSRAEWIYEAALGSNWRARSVLAGAETVVDVGIAADTAWHEFTIIGTTGFVNFFLDRVSLATITTNLPTGALGPHIRSTSVTTSTRDVLADWIEAYGNRA
jgi:hypothetical protein